MHSRLLVHLSLFLLLFPAVLTSCTSSSSEGDVDGDGFESDGDAIVVDGDAIIPDGDATESDGDSIDIDGDGDMEEADGDEEQQAVEPLFLEGCPEAGMATAMEITNPEQKMFGPDAIGTVGDYLLMNEKAAFIIEAPDNINAYYLYGGILVDAVALDGCSQASPERFEEVGFLLGTMNLTNYYMSVLRAFRGDSIEIVNDGQDGEDAIVRVSGADDRFWLVELTLLREAFSKGEDKPLSDPFNVEIVIDYILPPDSNVLTIEMTLVNQAGEEQVLITASEVMFGISTQLRYYSEDIFDIAGFRLEKGLPWMSASEGDGAWAFAWKGANMSTTNISGVTAIVDFNQALTDPVRLAPMGDEGDRSTLTYFVSVGPTDSNSAVKHLHAVNPEPLPDMPYTLKPIEGTVLAEESDEPLEGVLIEVLAENNKGEWYPIDTFHTDAAGAFSGDIADFGLKTPKYKLAVHLDGRPDPESVEITMNGAAPYVFSMDPGGFVSLDIRDDDDGLIPAKVLIYQENNLVKRIFTPDGLGEYPLPTGDYTLSVSRGYEYEVYEGDLTVIAEQTENLDVTLAHLVDTSGYLSVDTHCHAGPSGDNFISIPERIRTVAAEGLDVVVSTDHEFVIDWYPGVVENGLEDQVATVVGQEVTATMPEHTNMYPVVPDYSINARGGFVPWYGLDFSEIYAAEKARGADIRQLNHPRSYMSMVDYDPFSAEVLLDDPTLLGFSEDQHLWSWDFEAIELMNDPELIFADEANPGRESLFDDWMSFLNHGHYISALGVSDAHNYGIPGRPRNYFPSSSDTAAGFDENEMVAGILEGRTVLSAGAFARVSVNDTAELGDVVTDTDGSVDLTVHIEAIPEIDIQFFKVYLNCDQVLTVAADTPDQVIKYDGSLSVPVTEDASLVVAAFGENSIPKALGNYQPYGVPRVITNAIFIDADGNDVFDPPGDKGCDYDLDGAE